jgi:hypothetical protein
LVELLLKFRDARPGVRFVERVAAIRRGLEDDEGGVLIFAPLLDLRGASERRRGVQERITHFATCYGETEEVGVGEDRLRVDLARVFTEEISHLSGICRSHDELHVINNRI